MFEDNWKTWTLIALLACGGAFEVIKNLPLNRQTVSRDTLTDADSGLYSVRAGQPTKVAANSIPSDRAAAPTISKADLQAFIAAHATKKTEFEHKNKGAEGKAKKKKTAKKKKAKKKKPTSIETDVAFQSERFKRDLDTDSALNEVVATGALTPAPAQPKKEVFNTLEDWIKILLTQPELLATRHFVEKYQNAKVSAEIFYKIVALMVEDPRIEMKKLGLLALGLTPSMLSFQVLAEVQKVERADSEVGVTTNELLTRYTDVNQLRSLEQVLRQGTPVHATLLATQLLDQSAKRNLSVTPAADSSSGEVAAHSPTASANAPLYERFLTVLLDLTRSEDSTLANQAGLTLSQLQNLLQKSPTKVAQQSEIDGQIKLD